MAEQWSDEDRARLARRITEEMDRLRIDTDAEMIRRTGIAEMTWRKIKRGESVVDRSYRKVDGAFSWRRGSCEAILAGGEPTPADSEPPRQTYDGDELRELRDQLNVILDRIEEIQRRR